MNDWNLEYDIDLSEAITSKLDSFGDIQINVLRLDAIHPVVSGNKWFKLKYHIEEAKKKKFSSLITFGGAYSNHIVATAFAAREAKLKCTGIIRGVPFEGYDAATKEWVVMPSMPLQRHGLAGAVLGNRMHVVSGDVQSAGTGLEMHTDSHDAFEFGTAPK